MSGRQEMDSYFLDLAYRIVEKRNKILKAYFADLKASKTASSTHQYISQIKVFFDYLEKEGEVTYERLGSLRPADINIFLDWYKNCGKREKSDATMALMFNAVNSFYVFLEMNDYVNNNPCKKLKAQKVRVEKAPTYLTNDEIKKVADFILGYDCEYYWKVRDYLMFMLACRTGLRISAICSIDVSDIDFENNNITVVEKEKETRQIYFGENTKKLIIEWLGVRSVIMRNKGNISDALFITKKSDRITPVGARDMLSKYFRVIDYKHITPHKLRATYAQLVWEQFADIYLCSMVLGHKSVETTKRYVSVQQEKKKAAAEVLDSIV